MDSSQALPCHENSSFFMVVYAPLMWILIAIVSTACGLLVLLAWPVSMVVDRKRHMLHNIAIGWARSVVHLVPGLRYEFIGRENLPKQNEAVVYVANHQSQADILALLLLGVQFRWIAKDVLFRIPVFGWAMGAIGYVAVDRNKRSSCMRSIKKCADILGQGISMAFFPEGTRSPDGVLRRFKIGAFSLAVSKDVPVVPITIVGARNVLPKGGVVPRGFCFRLIIHSRISPQGRTPEALCAVVREQIASVLPPDQRGLSSQSEYSDD